MLDVAEFGARPAALETLAGRGNDLWRYAEALPLPARPAVSLGEGLTPLIPAPGLEHGWLKLDFVSPTLSFKDRGAVMLAALARSLGVRRAIADSSGNAGTALAGYLARAGVACEVFVPADTSEGKLAQMRAHGATVRLVEHTRADAARSAMHAAGEDGTFYASHVFHPYFLHGTKTYGYEVWEQLGGRAPAALVLPAGNGTLVLGCALAFSELQAAGAIARRPAIIGVQARACAPLVEAFTRGDAVPAPVVPGPTVAEGIAIADPPRGAQILAAVRATGGVMVSVEEPDVLQARDELARAGLFVEPTAAVCWAALRDPQVADLTEATGAQSSDSGDIVVPLCGAGLKVPAAH